MSFAKRLGKARFSSGGSYENPNDVAPRWQVATRMWRRLIGVCTRVAGGSPSPSGAAGGQTPLGKALLTEPAVTNTTRWCERRQLLSPKLHTGEMFQKAR